MRHARLLLFVLTAAVAAGCASTAPIADPVKAEAELAKLPNGPRNHMAAMAGLDDHPDDEAYLKALAKIMWRPGYTVGVREAAFTRLESYDLVLLKKTIRQRLPQMTMPEWHRRLCELIAERGWTDEEITQALISSWARPSPLVEDTERPEYLALVRLYGSAEVTDVVFDYMLESRKVSQQGFRTRCWALLDRLGQRDRLVRLLEIAEIAEDDAMLIDLRAAALELGIVPINREEILWVRELCRPERAEFWSQAVAAVAALSPERRRELDLRDLPILVSASLHDPAMLDATNADLYARVERQLKGRRRYLPGAAEEGRFRRGSQNLREYRDVVTWGDLAAMLIALQALEVRQVTAHLFDYALRDRNDDSTEFGGVLSLDSEGRFEVLEFPPRVRHHDQKFIASQAMFDAGYTALFHFHYHVQRTRNEEYAGPGMGDRNYADNTRANCLVLTSVGKGMLNVDFYRHGAVVIDLGTIEQ